MRPTLLIMDDHAHVRSIFVKLDLAVSPDDDRRALAVLTMLRAMP
jgi:hypothetical protein